MRWGSDKSWMREALGDGFLRRVNRVAASVIDPSRIQYWTELCRNRHRRRIRLIEDDCQSDRDR